MPLEVVPEEWPAEFMEYYALGLNQHYKKPSPALIRASDESNCIPRNVRWGKKEEAYEVTSGPITPEEMNGFYSDLSKLQYLAVREALVNMEWGDAFYGFGLWPNTPPERVAELRASYPHLGFALLSVDGNRTGGSVVKVLGAVIANHTCRI